MFTAILILFGLMIICRLSLLYQASLLTEEQKKQLWIELERKELEEEEKWDSWGVMKAIRSGKW